MRDAMEKAGKNCGKVPDQVSPSTLGHTSATIFSISLARLILARPPANAHWIYSLPYPFQRTRGQTVRTTNYVSSYHHHHIPSSGSSDLSLSLLQISTHRYMLCIRPKPTTISTSKNISMDFSETFFIPPSNEVRSGTKTFYFVWLWLFKPWIRFNID